MFISTTNTAPLLRSSNNTSFVISLLFQPTDANPDMGGKGLKLMVLYNPRFLNQVKANA